MVTKFVLSIFRRISNSDTESSKMTDNPNHFDRTSSPTTCYENNSSGNCSPCLSTSQHQQNNATTRTSIPLDTKQTSTNSHHSTSSSESSYHMIRPTQQDTQQLHSHSSVLHHFEDNTPQPSEIYSQTCYSSGYQMTSTNSTKHISSPYSEISSDLSSKLPSILCRIFVDGVGWALQLSNGEVIVQYNDGDEVCIGTSPMTINYTSSNKHTFR